MSSSASDTYADVANNAPSFGQASQDARNAVSNAADNVADSARSGADSVKSNMPGDSDAQKVEREARNKFQDAKSEAEKVGKDLKKEGKNVAKKVRESASDSSETASNYLSEFLSKPKYWVSSLGVVNTVLLGALGVFAYTRRDQIRNADRRLLTAGVVGVVAVLGGQGFFATDKALDQTGNKRK